MKKYNYYLVLFLMLVFNIAQATVYPNFSQMMTNTDYVVNPGITGTGGRISITNDILTVNIGASWTLAQNLKLGTIRTLAVSPVLPNLEIGELKTNTGAPTGYFLKIENNNVIIYTLGTPILLTGFNLSTTVGLVRTWYLDDDFDGLGDPLNAVSQYNKPAGNYVLDNTDNCPSIPGTNASCTVLEAGLINQSYIKTTIYKVPTSTSIVNPTISQANQNKTFFDGLGRPIQQIAVAQSGAGNDIITHMDYDVYTRMSKDFLPYATTSSSLNYRVNARTQLGTFYNTTNYENTINPYSEKVFENSPLNRVLKQAAPGSSWAVDSSHEIKLDYQSNSAGELTLFTASTSWNASLGLYNIALVSGVYGANQLIKTVTYDENTTTNPIENAGSTVEFKNREGQIVLKRTYDATVKHDTYYVYDTYGNLTYVIPPKATDLIGSSSSMVADQTSDAVITSGNILGIKATNSIRLTNGFNAQIGSSFTAVIESASQTLLDDLCYQYKYDQRNRLVEKKLPGKQWEFIVYDKLDRVVATGPVYSPFNDVTSIGWSVTKYDNFNRPVITAWLPAATVTKETRKTLQDSQNSSTANFSETKISSATNTIIPSVTGVAFRYTNLAWPTSGYHILTVNYFDDYNFPGAPTIPLTILSGDQAVYYNSTILPKGLPTASWIRVLESAAAYRYEQIYTLYDAKSRPVRTYTKNYLEGYTYTDSKLDTFSGQLKYSVTTQRRSSIDTVDLIIKDVFTYTNQDRLLTQTHQINGGSIETILSNTYDELGQLVSKRVGNNIQNINYAYNIRGWLKGINDINSLVKSGDQKDLFAFQINYTTSNTSGVTPLFNGNIAETYWATNSDLGTIRSYGYKFDNLNRLKEAIFKKGSTLSNAYNEALSYDKNGNIMGLTRYGNSETAVKIDDLVYSYANSNSTNQLLKVVDGSSKLLGFVDNLVTTDDYEYDANGNMIKDNNKTITAISYNHLNLPKKITFGSVADITYIYNALGQKVQKVVWVTSPVSTTITDYLGGFQYLNNILQLFATAEGYVEQSAGSYKYVYQYKDHLGNIRLNYRNVGSITTPVLQIAEDSNYYPFGLKHIGYNGTKNGVENKYKFQGQERQDELSLNWDSFKWRNYDYAIGRFMCIDPLAEKYSYQSPYNFAENRVIDGNELEGLEWVNAKNQQIYDPTANNGKGDYTEYATNMDRNIGNSLRTNTGQEQFNVLVNSTTPVQIDFNIKDTKADEKGKMIPGETIHTDLSVGTDNSGKVEDVSFSKSVITVYARNIEVLEQASNDGNKKTSGDLYRTAIPENLNFSDILGAILGHEIGHTQKENVLTMAKGGNAETEPTKVSNKILEELKN